MTHETLLTNSQEEQLLTEYFEGAEEMKELGNHLELDHYPSFSNLELTPQSSFLQQNVFEDNQPDSSMMADNKMMLQHQIAVVEQQQQFLQQQQQQQYVQQQQQQLPLLPTPIQCKEEYAGDYNFQLILNYKNSSKHWIYSEKLHKVFIQMEEVLPLQFSWSPPQDGLWVRATIVYKYDQHRSQPVLRCHNHMAPDNNANRNINPLQRKHVIRCTHSASSYEEAQNGHLSVLTPLGTPEAGVTNVPVDFVFYCKNSCTSGMNRRPTELIFTLETEQNQILGRRKLEVRVCSCPKRDKEKEEGETDRSADCGTPKPVGGSKKRKMVNVQQGAPPPPGKKVMMDQKQVFNLNLNVLGRENYNAIVKYAHDVMAGAAVRCNNYELYKPYMDEALKKYNTN